MLDRQKVILLAYLLIYYLPALFTGSLIQLCIADFILDAFKSGKRLIDKDCLEFKWRRRKSGR